MVSLKHYFIQHEYFQKYELLLLLLKQYEQNGRATSTSASSDCKRTLITISTNEQG